MKTASKQSTIQRSLTNVPDNSIKYQTIEQHESVLSQSVPISSSACIKNIITPHKLHEKEMINHNNVTDHTKQSNFETIDGLDNLSDATKDLNGVRIIYEGKSWTNHKAPMIAGIFWRNIL